MKPVTLAVLFVAASTGTAFAQGAPSRPDATVYFANLADGDTVASPVKVLFGLSGMGIAPAGVEMEGTGHHHLLLDRPPMGEGEDGAYELLDPIVADENNVHTSAAARPRRYWS